MDISQDYLLNKKVSLMQPLTGYRAGIDPVLVASCVPIKQGETFLDVGCGVGAALLCLGARVPECQGVGIEREGALADLARLNIEANHMAQRMGIVTGDIFHGVPSLKNTSFDHVVTNPPFVVSTFTSSGNGLKRNAHQEQALDSLDQWITFCLKRLKQRGWLTMIHRTDRLEDILRVLKGRLGHITLIPLWSKQGHCSKRFILTGRKGVSSPLTLRPGLIVHDEKGHYTPQAQDILLQGKSFFGNNVTL